MEIIEADARPGDDVVQIAFADTREEAELVRGLLREEGIRSLDRQAGLEGGVLASPLLIRSPRRIYVHPEDAARARTLLAETMIEDPAEEIPEPANAAYLADAAGHRTRHYSLFGAFVRFYLVAFVTLAVAFLVFLVLR